MTDAWAEIRADLGMVPEAPRNITAWTLTRHVRSGAAERIALRWRPRSGPIDTYSYGDLDQWVSRFASGLIREGVRRGETVAVLAGRCPEMVVAVLGALRAGAVPTVLFSAYGPDPLRRRLLRGSARLLVTTARLFRDKVAPMRSGLTDLRSVLLVEGAGHMSATAARGDMPEGTRDFGAWLAQGDAAFPDAEVAAEDAALLHFTSGTTGEPKGVVHVHDAIVGHAHTGKSVLGLREGTSYWCSADPGWVTGISYGVLAPLACGSTLFMDEEDFDAPRWWENLETQGVEVFYTSPTALRLLRRMDAAVERRPLPSLRSVFSVGEPLAPAEALWASRAFGVHVRDTWWQTETGSIVVATPYDEAPREGLVGHAVEGHEVRCLRTTSESPEFADPGEAGELVVRRGWPSMFREYLTEPALYQRSFSGPWYRSGDLAVSNAEGWVTFVGRMGDVFKSAGHLVSPSEIEAVLLDHPSVADAGVSGRDDPLAGSLIEAHVVLTPGAEDSARLRAEILTFARARLGPPLAPRALHVLTHLPRTPSGKIVRKDLVPSSDA